MNTEVWSEYERYMAAALVFLSYPDSVRESLWREANGQTIEDRAQVFTEHINRIAERIGTQRLAKLRKERDVSL